MSAPIPDKIDLLSRELYEGDPQPTYTWLRKNAPVYWDEINEIWGISHHADITSISRDPERFSSAQGSRPNTPGSGSMIDNDDPKHLAFRRIFQKEITPRAAKRFIPRIGRIVDDLFKGLEGREEFDLVKELAIPLPVRVILEALGLDDSYWERYAEIAEVTMAAGGGPRYYSEEMAGVATAYYGTRTSPSGSARISVWERTSRGSSCAVSSKRCSNVFRICNARRPGLCRRTRRLSLQACEHYRSASTRPE